MRSCEVGGIEMRPLGGTEVLTMLCEGDWCSLTLPTVILRLISYIDTSPLENVINYRLAFITFYHSPHTTGIEFCNNKKEEMFKFSICKTGFCVCVGLDVIAKT